MTMTLPPEEVEDLYNNAPCGYHSVDRNGIFVRINDTQLRWLGYARDEVLGKLRFQDLLTPGGVDLFERSFSAFKTHGTAQELELELRRKDGSLVPVLLNATALTDEGGNFVMSRSVMVDLTERKRSEDDLHRFFMISLDMLCIAGFDGYFREVNQAWTRTLGYSIDELKTKPFIEFVHPDDRMATLAETEKLVAGGETIAFENRYRCKDGSYRWLLWSAAVSVEKQLLYAVARDITERRQLEETLRYAAFHDPLTGLPNRSMVLERLGRMLERARRAKDYFIAVLYVDLDSFKPVNDTLGHVIGDQLLVGVSRRLEQCIRPGDLLGRFGGDEFVVVLSDVSDSAVALQVAGRIQHTLEASFHLSEHEVLTAASIGIVMSRATHERPMDLLREADAAMYRAKSLGGGRSAFAIAPGQAD